MRKIMGTISNTIKDTRTIMPNPPYIIHSGKGLCMHDCASNLLGASLHHHFYTSTLYMGNKPYIIVWVL